MDTEALLGLINTLTSPFPQKLGITGMFMFGIMQDKNVPSLLDCSEQFLYSVCVCSAMMLVTAVQYDDAAKDLTWGQVGPANWSAAEINLSIVTGG